MTISLGKWVYYEGQVLGPSPQIVPGYNAGWDHLLWIIIPKISPISVCRIGGGNTLDDAPEVSSLQLD
jgi:hypothetical protein